MGIFSKREVVFLKENNEADLYLNKLQSLLTDHIPANKIIEREIFNVKAGIFGENSIVFELKNCDMNMFVIRDFFVRTKSGREAQIDFLIITQKMIFIIECKNLFGDIEINKKGDFIRTIRFNNKIIKEGIYSPITQNERHLSIFKECLSELNLSFIKAFSTGIYSLPIQTLVILANDKTVINDKFAPKKVREQVYRADQLNTVLKKLIQDKSELELPISLKKIREISELILSMNQYTKDSFENRFEKIKSEAMKKDNSDISQEEVCCPKCGSKLVLRTAKKGNFEGERFWGCSTFPKCKYIKKSNNL